MADETTIPASPRLQELLQEAREKATALRSPGSALSGVGPLPGSYRPASEDSLSPKPECETNSLLLRAESLQQKVRQMSPSEERSPNR